MPSQLENVHLAARLLPSWCSRRPVTRESLVRLAWFDQPPQPSPLRIGSSLLRQVHCSAGTDMTSRVPPHCFPNYCLQIIHDLPNDASSPGTAMTKLKVGRSSDCTTHLSDPCSSCTSFYSKSLQEQSLQHDTRFAYRHWLRSHLPRSISSSHTDRWAGTEQFAIRDEA